MQKRLKIEEKKIVLCMYIEFWIAHLHLININSNSNRFQIEQVLFDMSIQLTQI